MKGIDKEFDFGVLFHPHYSLAHRQGLFNNYLNKYNIRLYNVVKGFSFPKLVETRKYTEDQFMFADGFVVGDKLSSDSSPYNRSGSNMELSL